MPGTVTKLIYLDTNVFARPFDDQSQPTIRAESNAFLEIVHSVKAKRLVLLSSDILLFEIDNILDEDKHTKVKAYLELCSQHIESSNSILELGKQLQNNCHIRPRDALHVASAILGNAHYFLSGDRKIVRIEQANCYRHFARSHRQEAFSVANPVRFIEEMRRGELK